MILLLNLYDYVMLELWKIITGRCPFLLFIYLFIFLNLDPSDAFIADYRNECDGIDGLYML